MKLPENNISSETSSIGIEKTFDIGNKGLIFGILRGKLYSDPISSLIREYASNAKDAHVEIGVPEKPIEIHLPNAFDMSLKIKDYGIGIDPSRMDNVFINYGNSTKRNDNNMIGGFGLGAKSSFAYTNQFSIITISDFENKRVRRTYIAYIDSSEEGKMRLVSEEETTDPTGTEIIIGVEKDDVQSFIEKTIFTFQYWKIKPILSGLNPLPEFHDFSKDEILTGSNWILYKKTGSHVPRTYDANGYLVDNGIDGAKVIIDGVCYPIESRNFTNLSPNHTSLLNNNIIFEFGIGSLTLAANREMLHYDENTINLIKERLNLAMKETPDLIKEKVKNSKNYLDASKNYRKLLSSINYITGTGTGNLNVDFDGKTLLNTNYLDFGTNPKGFLNLTFLYRNSSRTYKETLSCTGDKNKDSYHRVHVDIDIPVYINDLDEKESPRSRAKTILKTESKVQILKFFDGKTYNDIKDAYFQLKGIDLDWLEPKLLSTVTPTKEPIVRKPAARKEKSKINVYKYDERYKLPTQYHYQCWRPQAIEIDDDTISDLYVVFNNASEKKIKPYLGYSFDQYTNIKQIKKLLDREIYAVRDVDLHKLGKNFIRLEEFVESKVLEMETSGITIEDIFTTGNITTILDSTINKKEYVIDACKKSASKGVSFEFLKEYNRLLTLNNKTKEVALFKFKENKQNITLENTNLYKLSENVLKEYPLLQYLSLNYGSSEKDMINAMADYIKIINENKQQLQKTGS